MRTEPIIKRPNLDFLTKFVLGHHNYNLTALSFGKYDSLDNTVYYAEAKRGGRAMNAECCAFVRPC